VKLTKTNGETKMSPFKKPILIDFSGHQDIKVSVEDMADPFSFMAEAMRIVDLIENDSEWLKAAQSGKVVLILPGLSTLACAILSEFHGRYGYFPRIKWYIRNAKTGEFVVSKKSLDLQKIRYEARTLRK